jgi:hypothetical protein
MPVTIYALQADADFRVVWDGGTLRGKKTDWLASSEWGLMVLSDEDMKQLEGVEETEEGQREIAQLRNALSSGRY